MTGLLFLYVHTQDHAAMGILIRRFENGGSVVENISLSSGVQLAGKKRNKSKQTVQTLSLELNGEII